MSSDSSRVWLCGRCGRRVPASEEVCGCDVSVPQARRSPAVPEVPAEGRGRVAWPLLIAAVLLAVGVAWVLFRSGESTSGGGMEEESTSTSSIPPQRSPVLTVVSPSESAVDPVAVAYEEKVAALASVADRVDAYWDRYRRGCAPYSSGETFGREWFGIWNASLERLPQPLPECDKLLNQILGAAAYVKRGMEAAAPGDVKPGMKLDIRRKYRMEWSGWN